MFKKAFIALIVVTIIGVSAIPIWTERMAEEGFKNPEKSTSAENVQKAIKTRMYIYMYPEARKLSEKAVLYFPESRELPYFVYMAGLSSEKAKEYLAAIYWYGYFVDLFPKHEWTEMVRGNYDRLKGVYGPKPETAPKK